MGMKIFFAFYLIIFVGIITHATTKRHEQLKQELVNKVNTEYECVQVGEEN